MRFAVATLLVACLVQGNSAQWAIPRIGGTGMGGMGMGGMGSLGLSGSRGLGATSGLGSLSFNSPFPSASLRAVGAGPLQPLTAKNTWDCMQRNGGLLSRCGATGSAAAAFDIPDDDDDYDDAAPARQGGLDYNNILSLGGVIDDAPGGALEQEIGEAAMAEIRKLLGPTAPVGLPPGYDGKIVGDMNGLAQLSHAAETMIASAVSGVTDDELENIAASMSAAELVETIKGVETAVGDQSRMIEERLGKLINGPAAAAGCAPELIAAAITMSQEYAEVPARAALLVEEGNVMDKDCANKPMYQLIQQCKNQKLAPVTVRASQLARDTNAKTAEAMELMKQLRVTLKQCRTQLGIKLNN